jgi:glycosyltransferase involved in cell wall biosynthesis
MMVSVIIPNYNHSKFLKGRINSVLSQTYSDFEVIILDDCSTDDSRVVIEQYRNDPKVAHIIFNEKNSGSTFKQWDKGVALAKGDIIWIAESDDVAGPEFLSEMVPAISGNSAITVAYCQSNRMDAQGNITGDWMDNTQGMDPQIDFRSNFTMDGTDYIKRFLVYRNTIPNASAVLFRKNAFLCVDGLYQEIPVCGDWYLWLELVAKGSVYYNANKFNDFRYHDNSVIKKILLTDPYYFKYEINLRQHLKTLIGQMRNEEISQINQAEIRTLYFRQTKRYLKHFRLLDAAKNCYKGLTYGK